MVKDDARTYALLRQRDAAKRTRQVWAGATIVWAVLLGWIVWGFINAVTDVADSRVVWLLVYLLPVAVLAIGTVVVTRRIRAIDEGILAIAENAQHPRPTT